MQQADINQCSLEDMLQVIKGVGGLGEILCKAIVDDRTVKGTFKSWGDLKERVSGLKSGNKLQKLQTAFYIGSMSSGATVMQPVSPLL